jgi:hypothetical protein
VKYLFKKYVTKTDEVLWYQCLQCYKDASLSAIKALLKELKWSAFNILVRFQILMVTSMKMTTQHYILEDCHLQYYNFVYFWLLYHNDVMREYTLPLRPDTFPWVSSYHFDIL